jgi:hypothetical protein
MNACHRLSLAFFALLIFIAGAAHASTYTDACKPGNMGANGGSELIGIAFALVSFAIAAAYMYGKAMQNPKAEVWAKDEATNLVITILLFAGLVAFFSGACDLAVSYTGKSPFVASYNYLDKLVYNAAIPSLKSLVSGSLTDQKEATKYLYVGFIPYTGHGIAADANRRALSANKEFTIDLFLPMVASLSAQRQILQVLEIFSTTVLLPFAFILRLIPPTREMGNMLIALFFGLYIVAPTMYALSSNAFDKVLSDPMMHKDALGNPIYDFSDWSLGGESGSGALLFRIGSTMPQAIFVPNLVIIIVTTCTMSLAKGLRAIQA